MKTFLTNSAKCLCFISFLFFLLPLMKAQQNPSICKTDGIVQSPYHDAIQLRLASQGINIFFNNLNLLNSNPPVYQFDIFAYDSYTNEKLDLFKYDKKVGHIDSTLQAWVNKWVTDKFSRDTSIRIINKILARNIGKSEGDTIAIQNFKYYKFSYSDLINNLNTVTLANISTKMGTPANKLEFSRLGGGGPSFAAIFADGISQFAIDRIKEDFNTSVLNRLKKVMNDTPEFQKLFPNSWKQLKDLEDFNYSFYLNNLKPAFENDLNSLLGNVSSLSEIDKYKVILKDSPELCLLFTSFDLINGLEKEEGIVNTLQKVYSSPYIQETPDLNETNLIKLMGFISYALRDIKSIDNDRERLNKEWISFSQLKDLLADPILRNYYFGLLDAFVPNIQFIVKSKSGNNDTITFKKFLEDKSFDEYLTRMSLHIDKIKSDVAELKKLILI
jgi:hypothetical protein